MTHSGQGGEPQHPAARPAHEGVVLPGDGSEPWVPGSGADQDQVAPAGGQPWGPPWGPQDDSRNAQQEEQPGYDPGYGYGAAQQGPGQSYPPAGSSYGAPYAPGGAQPYDHRLPPAQTPLPGSADATQYLPPVPATGEADATQYIAPVPQGPGMLPPENGAEATQFLPAVPGSDADATQFLPAVPASDADATQFIAPVPAYDVPPRQGGDTYGMRPGDPEDRQPPAEFDSLFRTDGAGGQEAGSTQQLPQFDPSHAPQPYGQQTAPYGQGTTPYEPPAQRRTSYDPQGPPPQEPQGRGAARRKASPLPIIAAVVVGCAVIGLGAGWLMSGGDGTEDSKGAASASSPAAHASTQTAGDPGKPQAAALDKLLADSNNSRESVIGAVGDIKSCDNLDQAAGDLHAAAEQRKDLVTRLKGLTIDQLPDHGELTSSLTRAWQASAAADDHYAQWASQAKGRKVCKNGHARRTESAAEGDRSSGQATTAKNQASKLWNTVASKYGLPERSSQDL